MESRLANLYVCTTNGHKAVLYFECKTNERILSCLLTEDRENTKQSLSEEVKIRINQMILKKSSLLAADCIKSVMKNHHHRSFLATDDRIADEACCTAFSM